MGKKLSGLGTPSGASELEQIVQKLDQFPSKEQGPHACQHPAPCLRRSQTVSWEVKLYSPGKNRIPRVFYRPKGFLWKLDLVWGSLEASPLASIWGIMFVSMPWRWPSWNRSMHYFIKKQFIRFSDVSVTKHPYIPLRNVPKTVSSVNTLRGIRIVEVNRERLCPGEEPVGRKEVWEAKA